MSLDCPRATATASTQQPIVVDLDHELARQPAVSGAKAAALARAKAAGLSVLPGFAVTTAGARDLVAGRAGRRHAAELHEAWKALSDTGRRALVVRSSSTIEDGGSQSMAGLFTSVLDDLSVVRIASSTLRSSFTGRPVKNAAAAVIPSTFVYDFVPSGRIRLLVGPLGPAADRAQIPGRESPLDGQP